MNRNRLTRILAATAAAAVLPSALVMNVGAAGPNLVSNGDFSQGAAHWHVSPYTTAGAFTVSKGVAILDAQPVNGASSFGIQADCIPVHDGETFKLSTDMQASEQKQASVRIDVTYYDDANCHGNMVSDQWYWQPTAGSTVHYEQTTQNWAGGKSARVEIGTAWFQQPGTTPPANLFARFDNVKFVPQ